MSSVPEIKQQIILLTLLIHNIGYLLLYYFNVIHAETKGAIFIAIVIQIYLMHLALTHQCFRYLAVRIQKIF